MGVLTEIIDSYQWTNFLNPNNIKGLSAFSMLLAMIGNGLMIPRALFIRDFMWYVSSPTQNLYVQSLYEILLLLNFIKLSTSRLLLRIVIDALLQE